ncbi:MAG: hypothetical protein A3K19_25060 [Lentisphaerae bacterium RIFOXYB12_FULL_65_16]|nr:MAG: hypothetical protein A3K18_00845 [Lentisphaerae bacterium RIFOXYA12_64_32]OGV91016.1 MAG: hypothetical protein A3K19_25060 [Lentisphaerae bacterium RIFOXYB12_FULL_65_16]
MTTDSVVLTAKPGKYLAVRHGREEYGIDVQKVFIVTRLKGPTRDPRAPGLVQAVINLRGKNHRRDSWRYA